MDLSIIIPTVDSEKYLAQNITTLDSALKNIPSITTYEIIVAAQTSPDNTFDVLKRIKNPNVRKVYVETRGKGAGLTAGIRTATGDWCLTLDDDLAYLNHLPTFLQHRPSYDLIIASRYVPHAELDSPFSRRVASTVYILLTKLLLDIKQRDIQAGMKLINHTLFEKIPYPRETGYAWDTELLYHANKQGARILEVPVKLAHAPNQLKLSRAAPRMLRALIRLWRHS